jgi:hypothetical protein
MTNALRGIAVLLGALTLTLSAHAQQNGLSSVDFGLTYSVERAKIASTACGCFWMQGSGLDAALGLYRGLSVAVSVTGETSSNIAPGVDLSKVAVMAGPRYTLNTGRWMRRMPGLRHGTGIFGEALVGGVHGFNGVFSTPGGIRENTNSLSLQFGGGLNIGLAKGFGLRAIEVDYVRSRFRDFGSNTQNDLRLAAGVTFHLSNR